MYLIALVKRACTEEKLRPGLTEELWEDCEDAEADDATPAFPCPKIDVSSPPPSGELLFVGIISLKGFFDWCKALYFCLMRSMKHTQ